MCLPGIVAGLCVAISAKPGQPTDASLIPAHCSGAGTAPATLLTMCANHNYRTGAALDPALIMLHQLLEFEPSFTAAAATACYQCLKLLPLLRRVPWLPAGVQVRRVRPAAAGGGHQGAARQLPQALLHAHPGRSRP